MFYRCTCILVTFLLYIFRFVEFQPFIDRLEVIHVKWDCSFLILKTVNINFGCVFMLEHRYTRKMAKNSCRCYNVVNGFQLGSNYIVAR